MAENFNRSSSPLTTTSPTLIYQAPGSGSVIVLSCLAVNISGSASCDVTVAIKDSGDAHKSYVAYTIPVPADSTLELIANKLILKGGERLVATATSVDCLEVTASVLEIT